MGLGIFLTLLATLGWGAGDVFARKAMFGASAETVLVVMIAMTVATLGVIGVVLEGVGAFGSKDLGFFAATALMGLLTWVTGNLLYFHGMRLAGVVLAAPILGTAPLVAIMLAVVLGGERPGAGTIVGAVVVVTGVGVLVTDRDRVLR